MNRKLPEETVSFPAALRSAMAAGGHEIGLTAKIGKEALEVTLRARDRGADAPVEFVRSPPPPRRLPNWPALRWKRRLKSETPGRPDKEI